MALLRRPLAVIGVACALLTAARAAADEPEWRGNLEPPQAFGISARSMPLKQAPQSKESHVTLTIRGGISLGAYEAGVNWAMLRFFAAHRAGTAAASPTPPEVALDEMVPKPIVLRAVSGASAGNINAFLSALEWCAATGAAPGATPSSVESNLFWDAWIPVGLDTLFPARRSCHEYARALGPSAALDCERGDDPYYPGDGLFSRHAFDAIKQTIDARLERKLFRTEGCVLPVGVSLTRLSPTVIDLAGIPVTTQRAFAALRASSLQGDGTLVFEAPPALPDFPLSLGQLVHLPAPEHGSLNRAIFDVIEASSAFPTAFGAKTTLACDDAGGTSCKPTTFLDGGVFDNAPIRLAKYLAQTTASTRGAPARDEPVHLLYIDPDLPERGDPMAESSHDRGLSGAFAFLRGAIDTTREAEMLLLAQELGLERQVASSDARPVAESDAQLPLVPIQRRARVYGARLGAFASFVARAFRRYDYYAGLYDGVRTLALDRCTQGSRFWVPLRNGESETSAQRDECLVRTMKHVFDELGIASSRDASYVFGLLLEQQLRGIYIPGDLTAFARPNVKGAGPAIVAVAAAIGFGRSRTSPTDLVSTLLAEDGTLASLEALARDPQLRELRGQAAPRTIATVATGRGTQRRAQRKPSRAALPEDVDELLRITRDPHQWAQHQTEDMLARLAEIEAEDRKAGEEALGELAADAAQAILRQSTAAHALGLGFQDTLPDRATPGWALRLLPTIIDVDFRNDGVLFRYQGRLGLSPALALTLPVTPLWFQRSPSNLDDFRHFGAVGLGVQWRSAWFLDFALELDLHHVVDWDGPEPEFAERWAGEVAAYFFAGKLRLSAIAGRGPAFTARDPWGLTVKLGIADIPGILYWLIHLAT